MCIVINVSRSYLGLFCFHIVVRDNRYSTITLKQFPENLFDLRALFFSVLQNSNFVTVHIGELLTAFINEAISQFVT